MTRRALTILIAAVVAIAFAAAVIATSVGGNDDSTVMPAGTHRMDDGSTMSGSSMEK